MILKIIGKGFIFNKGAYLRDAWNILDFVIVVSAYFEFMNFGSGVNIGVLWSFWVLRPLRTISGVEGLKIIVQCLLKSVPLLWDAIAILLFFFLVMAIAGVQMFSGVLKKWCIKELSGSPHPDDLFCGGGDGCPSGYFCGKIRANPYYGFLNFDNVYFAFLAVFTTVTLEGWSEIMVML